MAIPSSNPTMPVPVAASTVSSVPAVRARPNWPFLLASVPTDWEVDVVDGKPMLLPVLRQVTLQPGVNMVRTRDRTEPTDVAITDATAYAKKRGWTVLSVLDPVTDPAHLPKGAAAGPYLRELPARAMVTDPVGKLYIDVWEVPVATPGDEEQAFQRDRASFNRWRSYLVTSGVIAPPSELIKQRLLNRARTHLERKQATPYPDAELKSDRVKKLKDQIKSIETAKVPGQEAA